MKTSLNFSEQFILIFFFSLVLSIVLISKISSWKVKAFLSELKTSEVKTLLVHVSGEGVRSADFEVPFGSVVGDVLKQVSLKPFADLSYIDPKEEASSSLVIPRLESICVRVLVEGFEPQDLIVPVGSRVSDLKSKISLNKDSDVSSLRSRRKLSHHEVIFIAKKKKSCT